eukprot:4251100-Prymnesium_polylepis.2
MATWYVLESGARPRCCIRSRRSSARSDMPARSHACVARARVRRETEWVYERRGAANGQAGETEP